MSPGGYLLQAGSVDADTRAGAMIGYRAGPHSVTHRTVWLLGGRITLVTPVAD